MVWSILMDERYIENLNPLSANFIKWADTLKQFVSKLSTKCLSVFDLFVGLALKGLKLLSFSAAKVHCVSDNEKPLWEKSNYFIVHLEMNNWNSNQGWVWVAESKVLKAISVETCIQFCCQKRHCQEHFWKAKSHLNYTFKKQNMFLIDWSKIQQTRLPKQECTSVLITPL